MGRGSRSLHSPGEGQPFPEIQMLRKFLVSAVAVISAAGAVPIGAQRAPMLGVGARVRLAAPLIDDSETTGKILSATGDTIQFRSDSRPVTRTLARADLTSLEVSAGWDTHRGRDALYGLVLGGGAGAIAGALSYKKQVGSCYWLCETRSGDAAAGGIVGGLAGALIGAVVGGYDRTERWVPLTASTRAAVIPAAGGASVVLTRSF